ncbi:MAG: hypothetical protein ACKOPE_12865 [Novosphingobium sp.]
MTIFLPILAQGALFGAEPLPDPMAGVTQDWLLCSEPDDAAKTCRALTTFIKTSDGRFEETNRAVVIGLPGLVIEVPGLSYVKDGKLCSIASRNNIQRARVIRHVEGVSPQREAAALKQLEFFYPVEGKEVCSNFYPNGEHFRIDAWANGKLVPELGMQVRWVHKDDGYDVAGWHGAITTPQGASH